MFDCLLRGRPTVIKVCVTPSSVAVIYCLHFHRVALFPISNGVVQCGYGFITSMPSIPHRTMDDTRLPFPFHHIGLYFPSFPYIIPRTFTGGAADWTMHLARAFHFAPADSITAPEKMVLFGQIARRERCAARRGDKWEAITSLNRIVTKGFIPNEFPSSWE